MRIPCFLPQLFLFPSNQSENSPHRRVPQGTAGSTGHTQSSSRGRAPHCCSQSSPQDRSASGSAHTPRSPEHPTYYWDKHKSKNVYKHNIPAALNSLLHEKTGKDQWVNEALTLVRNKVLTIHMWQMRSHSGCTYCTLLATSPVFHPITSSC